MTMKSYIVEKDLVLHNLDVLLRQTKSPIWAVLKGNGYGLGVRPMAELCMQKGIHRFAVTELSEAAVLRELCPSGQILLLRPTTDEAELRQMLELDVIATIGSSEDAAALSTVSASRGEVAEVHVKIDTGMGRYGFLPEETEKILNVYRYYDNIAVSGIYTHFHSAFCSEKATMAQAEAFKTVLKTISDAGIETGMPHCCNSNAFLRWPELHMEGARIGSALLGRVTAKSKLKRIGCCQATVDEVRWLPAGHSTGYGAGWTAKKPTQIAVLPVGWYHGFTVEHGNDLFRFRDNLRRIFAGVKGILLRKRIFVYINGKKCPVLGHVGMLHTVVDVTKIRCNPGDKATLDINPILVRGMQIEYR
jgi:alanine racemase